MTDSLPQWKISHNHLIQYDIISSTDLFNVNNTILLSEDITYANRRFIVIDHIVYKQFSRKINDYFRNKNVLIKVIKFSSGEENKSIKNYISILKELDDFNLNRRSEPIIAIGGGVLTDLVGFVAYSYRRGVPYIKIPTTLMGYVDASIGIKTGFNFNTNKNRVGAFAPPQKVILDRVFFTTLSERHIINGVGEIVKLGVIKTYKLFELLELYGEQCIKLKFQDNISMNILNESIKSMIEELEPNLFELNLERAVDFGHTFSPAIEMCQKLNFLHGEAVVIDIALSSVLSFIRNLLSEQDLSKILNLLIKLKFTIYCNDITPTLLLNSLNERIKHRDGLQRVPIPVAIGKHTFINDININELKQVCKFLKEWIYNK